MPRLPILHVKFIAWMYEKIVGTTGAGHFRQVIKYKSAGLVVTKKRLSDVQNFVSFSKKEISQMQVGTARNQKRLKYLISLVTCVIAG